MTAPAPRWQRLRSFLDLLAGRYDEFPEVTTFTRFRDAASPTGTKAVR